MWGQGLFPGDVVWGWGCPEGMWYGDKAVPQRAYGIRTKLFVQGVWSEERTASWGVEDEAVGVQLLLSVAVEGQVSPWPQIREHQECQGRDFTGEGMTTTQHGTDTMLFLQVRCWGRVAQYHLFLRWCPLPGSSSTEGILQRLFGFHPLRCIPR